MRWHLDNVQGSFHSSLQQREAPPSNPPPSTPASSLSCDAPNNAITMENDQRLPLTHNEANFAEMIIVATGHHGSHRVVDHSHDVGVKVLSWDVIAKTIKHTHTHTCAWRSDHRSWVIGTHPSFLDGSPQKADDVPPLNPTRLEGFGPRQQNALQSGASFMRTWPRPSTGDRTLLLNKATGSPRPVWSADRERRRWNPGGASSPWFPSFPWNLPDNRRCGRTTAGQRANRWHFFCSQHLSLTKPWDVSWMWDESVNKGVMWEMSVLQFQYNEIAGRCFSFWNHLLHLCCCKDPDRL